MLTLPWGNICKCGRAERMKMFINMSGPFKNVELGMK